MNLRIALFAAAFVLAWLHDIPILRANGTSQDVRAGLAELERNKAVVRRVYEEGLSQGVFEVPYTQDFVGHGGNALFRHADGIAEAMGWRLAFPDLKVDVDLILAEGDLVSVRWTARGTNTGAGNGIPATGKQVKVSGTTVFRMADGAIAEEWTSGDSLGLLKQLGLFPAPMPAAGAAPAQ